jgi:hypothetical protein
MLPGAAEQPRLPPPAGAPAPPTAAPSVERPDVGALQLLALFQREGRLVDFLNEGIDGYDDASIGAAVRDIHRGCRKVLDEHLGVRPVVDGAEDESITVDAGFDPGRIRLVGNVAGTPPFKGVLRHHGWMVVDLRMPALSSGVDPKVVAPAEVELP